ncbi:hypothetical protein KAI78_07075 [bacterium]|nr:hypothetical protein [bacterium]
MSKEIIIYSMVRLHDLSIVHCQFYSPTSHATHHSAHLKGDGFIALAGMTKEKGDNNQRGVESVSMWFNEVK